MANQIEQELVQRVSQAIYDATPNHHKSLIANYCFKLADAAIKAMEEKA